MAKRYVCAECGNPVGIWHFGWKHQRGGNSLRPSCGRRPRPVEVEESEREVVEALVDVNRVCGDVEALRYKGFRSDLRRPSSICTLMGVDETATPSSRSNNMDTGLIVTLAEQAVKDTSLALGAYHDNNVTEGDFFSTQAEIARHVADEIEAKDWTAEDVVVFATNARQVVGGTTNKGIAYGTVEHHARQATA